MPKIILKINTANDKIYDHDNIVCYVADTSLPLTILQKLHGLNKLLLLSGEGAAEVCKNVEADGVLAELDPGLPTKVQVHKIRDELGTQKILGAVIVARRHEAMLVSETEPAFVAFKCDAAQKETTASLIKWYNELFLIQSALDLTAGLCDIKDIETDFVIINSADYADFSC